MRSTSDIAWLLVITLVASSCGGKTTSSVAGDAATPDAGDPCAFPDRDGDGFDRLACGGGDCDDDDDGISPGAIDAAPHNRWTFVRLDSTVTTGSVEMAMGRDGVAHAAFVNGLLSDQPNGLSIVEIGPGTIGWAPVRLAGGRIYPFALAVSETDVEVLYGAGQNVFFASRSGGWSPALVTILDADVGGMSILHDADGRTHIFYQQQAHARPPDAVHSVRLADGSWDVLESVAGTAAAHSPEGDWVVAYSSGGDLYVDRLESGQWSSERVDDLDETGLDAAVAIGATGEVLVSYLDLTRGDLKVASRSDGAWTAQTIDENGRVGDDSSIAIDPSGEPAVVYAELYEGSVRFARRSANGWSFGRLPSPVRVYPWPRLVFAPTGAAIIAFTSEEHEPWVALMGRDGVDQNCDGIDGVDADFDGHASVSTGGDDCLDTDPDAWQCRR